MPLFDEIVIAIGVNADKKYMFSLEVVAWRMLSRLRAAGWTQELLEQMYFDEDDLEWQKPLAKEKMTKIKSSTAIVMGSF
jgi:hypothetical protein